MRRSILLPLACTLLTGLLAGCGDEFPTATHTLTPVDPISFEVRLPWSQFASNLRVLGNFGRLTGEDAGLLAHQYAGKLEARTLVDFGRLPRSATVLDSLGTTRTDTMLTFIGANVIVAFDTTSRTNATTPIFLRVDRIDAPWDAESATWEMAVDSQGVRQPWAQPGGGPLVHLATGAWDPGSGAVAFIPIDSAETAFLRDTLNANRRGIMISMETAGQRIDLDKVTLQLQVIPSLNQDTLVFLDLDASEQTYIYTPAPAAPGPNEVRIGGVPAWRTILTLGLPATVPGTPAVCARTTCPVAITADRINHASLLLTTVQGDPAFAPSDTMFFEARGVLAPEVLPKSPITGPLYVDTAGRPVGATVFPNAFQPGGSRRVELPITPLIRDLVAGSSSTTFRPTPTIALMEVFEPLSFSFGTFAGPGAIGEPTLRIVLTISDPVALP